jgi:hypothetical protein
MRRFCFRRREGWWDKRNIVVAFEALRAAGYSGNRAARILDVPHCSISRWKWHRDFWAPPAEPLVPTPAMLAITESFR